jgi:hypothetical protein
VPIYVPGSVLLQSPTITLTNSSAPITGAPVVSILLQGHDNLLSLANSSFDNQTNTYTITNATTSYSSNPVYIGAYSLELTAIANGNITLTSPNIPFTADTYSTIMAYVYATVTRTTTLLVSYYDQAGTLLLSAPVNTIADSAAWTQTSVYSQAPANTAYLTFTYTIESALAGEIHYIDNLGVFPDESPSIITEWTVGGQVPQTASIYTSTDNINFTPLVTSLPLSALQTASYLDYSITGGQTAYYQITLASGDNTSAIATASIYVPNTVLPLTTLGGIIADIRIRLDSTNTTTSFWTDTELTNWVNEACTDIARRAEVLEETYSYNAAASQSNFTLPSNTIRVHRLEFMPTGSILTYPVEYKDYNVMDTIWGTYQNVPSAFPAYYTMWGQPPAISIKVYPVPAVTGTYIAYYYALPTPVVNFTDVMNIPAGWSDMVSNYVEFTALRKARDPRWQEAAALYQEKVDKLIDVTRKFTDESGSIANANNFYSRNQFGYDWF